MTTVVCRFVSVDSQPAEGVARLQVKAAHPGVGGVVIPSCMETPVENGVARFDGVQPGDAELTITPPSGRGCQHYASWHVTIPDTEEITLVELLAGGEWQPPQVTALQASLAEARELLAGLPDAGVVDARIAEVTGRVDMLEGKIEEYLKTPPTETAPTDEWEEWDTTDIRLAGREMATKEWLTGDLKVGFTQAHAVFDIQVEVTDPEILTEENIDPGRRFGGKYLPVAVGIEPIADSIGDWEEPVFLQSLYGDATIAQFFGGSLMVLIPVAEFSEWSRQKRVRFTIPRIMHQLRP